MAERFNRTPLQRLYVESMMRVNPKYIDFVHAEMVRCTSLIVGQGIPCEPLPRIVVSRKALLQPVMFDKPNFIIVNFLSIQSMGRLQENFREVMASYAMQMHYLRQQEDYRLATRAVKVERPAFNEYKSPMWAYALSWFTN